MTKSVKVWSGYYVDFDNEISVTATSWTFTSKSSTLRVTSSSGASAAGTVTERMSTKLGSASETNIYSDVSKSFNKGATSVTIRSSSKSRTVARTTLDQTITVRWYVSIESDAWASNVVESTYTIPALTKYTVTYNANGGSGAPAAQTKYYGQTLKLSTTAPTRTNCRFKGWATSPTGSVVYAAGANYTANAAVTLYAVWQVSYGVTYNANGGSGAPASQLKWSGETLKLQTGVPTRADFQFAGWATSSNGAVAYQPGGNYTTNAAVTLYAVWTRVYRTPVMSLNSVYRVNVSTHEISDSGTSVAVDISWDLFNTPSGTNHPDTVDISCNSVTNTITTLTGTTGSSTIFVDAGCDPNSNYIVTITLTDEIDEGVSGRSVTVSTAVPNAYFPLDIRMYGKGVAIGGPSNEDALDVFMPLRVLPRSSSASEIPIEVNDGVRSVFQTDWDGNIIAGNPEENEWSLKVRTEGRVGDVIKVINTHDPNGYGDEIVIGNGGRTIIGAGESMTALRTVLTGTPGDERMYVASDNQVYVYTNCQAIADCRYFCFGNDGTLYVYNPTIDNSTGSGLSSNVDQKWIIAKDKNDRVMGQIFTRAYPTGNVESRLECIKYLNGTNVWNAFSVLVNNDGSRAYYVADQAAFRTAIGVGQYTSPTTLPLNSACTAYDSGSTPKYMKEGRVVTVTGAVKPAAAVESGGTLTIGTLPSGFRPQIATNVLCQGSGRTVWVLNISTAGVLSASRYRDEEGAHAMSTSIWLPFHATFIVSAV